MERKWVLGFCFYVGLNDIDALFGIGSVGLG